MWGRTNQKAKLNTADAPSPKKRRLNDADDEDEKILPFKTGEVAASTTGGVVASTTSGVVASTTSGVAASTTSEVAASTASEVAASTTSADEDEAELNEEEDDLESDGATASTRYVVCAI
jgi:hypothetical protein